MATPGASINISVFKELSKELQDVSSSTSFFKSQIADLVQQLQGLSSIISTIPGGLQSLNQQMKTSPGQFSTQNITQAIQPEIPSQAQPTLQPKTVQLPTYEIKKPQVQTLIDASTGISLPVNRQEKINLDQTPPVPPALLNRGEGNQAPIPVLEMSGHLAAINTVLGRLLVETERSRSFLEQISRTGGGIGTPAAAASREAEAVYRGGMTAVEQRELERDYEFAQGLRRVETEATDQQNENYRRDREFLEELRKKQKEDQTVRFETKATEEQERERRRDWEFYRDLRQPRIDTSASQQQERDYELDRKFYESLRTSPVGAEIGADSLIASRERWGKRAAVAAGLLRGTADLTRTGFNLYQGMETPDITAEREIMAGQGAFAQKVNSQWMGQFDLYNARNLMKYGGNVIAPNIFEFAGPQGFQKAKDKALEELTREQQLKETGLKTEMVTGGLGTGASALGSIAQIMLSGAVKKAVAGAIASTSAGSVAPGIGNLIGAGVGGYMIYDAIRDTMAAASRLPVTYATHPALEMTGGRAGTLVGQMANAVFGTQESGDIAERTRRRFAIDQANQVMDRARSRQEAEINQFPFLEQSLQQYQNLKQQRLQRVGALGAYATLPIMPLDAISQRQLTETLNVGDTEYRASYDRATREAERAGVVFDPTKNTLTQLRRTLSEQTSQTDIQKTQTEIQQNLKRRLEFIDLMKKRPGMINALSKEEIDYATEQYIKDPTELAKLRLGTHISQTPLTEEIATKRYLETKAAELKRENQTRTDADAARITLAEENARETGRASLAKSSSEIIDRMMKKDQYGNYTNLPFANLGLGAAEVAQRAWNFQNILGVGQMQTTGAVTGRSDFMALNRLSQSGVGSFEQLLGNITTLQQLRGGTTQQNEQQLETILAKGVKAGFEGSRLSQNLVNLVTNISGNLDLRATGGVTSQLLEGARLAGGGTINERTIRESATGLQRLAEITGQREGPLAALRLAGILGSGLAPGKGAEILFSKSSVQARDMEQQIDQYYSQIKGAKKNATLEEKIAALKQDPSIIQNQEIRSLIRENEAGVLSKGIKQVEGLSTQLMSQLYDRYVGEGEQKLTERLASIRSMDKGKAKSAREELADKLYARAATAGMGEAANAFIAEELTQAGATPQELKELRSRKARIDQEQRDKAALESSLASFGQAMYGRKLTAEQYGKILTSSNLTAQIGGREMTGEDIINLSKQDRSTLSQEKQYEYDELQRRLKTITPSQLIAQQQQRMSDISTPPQKVTLNSIDQSAADTLAQAIAKEMEIRDQIRQGVYKGPGY